MPDNPHDLAPIDDAHINRNAKRTEHVTVNGQTFSIDIPAGYRLITVGQLSQMEATMREAKRRVEDEYRKQLLEKDDVIHSQLRINAGLQHRMDRAITQHREVREEMQQARLAIAKPFRWIYLALIGRALAKERLFKQAHFNEILDKGE